MIDCSRATMAPKKKNGTALWGKLKVAHASGTLNTPPKKTKTAAQKRDELWGSVGRHGYSAAFHSLHIAGTDVYQGRHEGAAHALRQGVHFPLPSQS